MNKFKKRVIPLTVGDERVIPLTVGDERVVPLTVVGELEDFDELRIDKSSFCWKNSNYR